MLLLGRIELRLILTDLVFTKYFQDKLNNTRSVYEVLIVALENYAKGTDLLLE